MTYLSPHVTLLLANLWAASLLFLAWWAFIRWQQSKEKLYLALYAFILAFILVSYFLIPIFPYGWVLALTGLLVGAVIFLRLMEKRKPASQLNIIRWSAVISLLLASAVPTLSYEGALKSRRAGWPTGSQQIVTHSSYLNATRQSLEEKITALGSQDQFKSLLNQKKYSDLSALLTTTQTEKGLQFLLLADMDGLVVSRTTTSLALGTKISQELPWTATVLEGKSKSGPAYNEQGLPTLVAGYPIFQEGVQTASLVGGLFINQQFAAEQAAKTGTNLGYITPRGLATYAANSPWQKQIYNSGDFSQFAAQIVKKDEKLSPQGILILNNTRYYTTGQVLSTLSNHPLGIFTLHHAPTSP